MTYESTRDVMLLTIGALALFEEILDRYEDPELAELSEQCHNIKMLLGYRVQEDFGLGDN